MCIVVNNWKTMQNSQNWAFQIISGHFGRKTWEKEQNNQN